MVIRNLWGIRILKLHSFWHGFSDIFVNYPWVPEWVHRYTKHVQLLQVVRLEPCERCIKIGEQPGSSSAKGKQSACHLKEPEMILKHLLFSCVFIFIDIYIYIDRCIWVVLVIRSWQTDAQLLRDALHNGLKGPSARLTRKKPTPTRPNRQDHCLLEEECVLSGVLPTAWLSDTATSWYSDLSF